METPVGTSGLKGMSEIAGRKRYTLSMAKKNKNTKEYVFSLDEDDAISITLLQKSGIGLPTTDISIEEWEEDWCFVLESPQLVAYRLGGDVEWVYDRVGGWKRA